MICFVSRFVSPAAILAVLLTLSSAFGEATWTGATSNDVNVGSNWLSGTVPNISIPPNGVGGIGPGGPGTDGGNTDNQVNFVNQSEFGNPVINSGETFYPRRIKFYGNINSISGTGTLIVGNANGAGNTIDSYKATGPVTISVADIVMNRSTGLSATGGTLGTADLVINSNTIKWSTNASAGNVIFTAKSGNILVNPELDFSEMGTGRSLNLLADAGKTITLTNGIKPAATTKLVDVNVGSNNGTESGTSILGDSTTLAQTINIMSGSLLINNNTSLGAIGNAGTGYTQPFGGGNTGALILTNGISVDEFIWMGARTTANNPHIRNQSGNNTITGTLQTEVGFGGPGGGNGGSATDKYFVISSEGMGAGDQLTLAGTVQTFTGSMTPTAVLSLQGAGKGFITGDILEQAGNVWNVEVNGSGVNSKWTFSNYKSYTGTTTVNNGGKLALDGTAQIDLSPSIVLKSGGTFDVTGRSGSLYTLASSQTLRGKGTVLGNISAGFGNTINPGETGDAGTLNITGNLEFTGGASLAYDLSSNPAGASNDKLNVTGGLSPSGVTTIDVSMTNGSLGNGTYRLIDYAGAAISNPDDFFQVTGVSLSPRQTDFDLTSVANQLNLVVIGGPATLTWTGGNGSTWDNGGTLNNWTGAADNHFYDGDNVIFATTGTKNPVVSGTVNAGNITFTNGSGSNYEFNGGSIVSGGAFAMNGAGDVKFASGDVTLSGAVSINGGGTLEFANSSSTLSLSSTVAINSGALAVNRTDELTISTALTGAGTFRKANTNTLTLSGNNTGFSGPLQVTAGTLVVGSATALGSSVTTVSSGAALDLGGTDVVSNTVKIAGVGNGVIAGALMNTGASANIKNVELTGNATIGGAGRIDIGARPNATPTGSFIGNNFDLTVDTSAEMDVIIPGDMGVKDINIAYTGGGAPNVLYIGGGTTLGSTAPGDSINLGQLGRLGFYGRNNVAKLGAAGATGAVTKEINIADGATAEIELYEGNMTIGSPIHLGNSSSVLSTELYLDTNGTWTLTYSGPITGGGDMELHSFTTSASRFGAVAFTNSGNAYTGKTVIGGSGGFNGISFGTDRIVGVYIGDGGSTGSIGTGDITITPAGGTDATDGTLATALYLNRTGAYGVSANIIMNGIADAASVRSIANGNATLSGIISGTGQVRLTTGKVTLSNSNTYTGTTLVNGGTLLVNGTHTGGAAYTVSTGGTLGGTGTIDTSATAANITLAAGGSLSPGDSGGGTLTVALGGGTLDLSAITAGALKFDLGVAATPSTSDHVVLDPLSSGTLDIGTLDFADFAFTNIGGVTVGGVYKLLDASSAISGSLGTLSGTFGGFSATLSIDNSTEFDVLLTITGTSGLPGDYNLDNKVDAADYVLWRKNVGNVKGTLPNDTSPDNPIGNSQYALWRSNFGNPPGAGSGSGLGGDTAVPEPTTCALLVGAVLGLLGSRRSRSSAVR